MVMLLRKTLCAPTQRIATPPTASKNALKPSTLLADLLENAIIATEENNRNKAVRVEFIKSGASPCIRISDISVPLPDAVKKSWGIRRMTTRAANGGNGIGMMTIFEICKRYHASFSVETLAPESVYTKCVSVCFDDAGHYSFEDIP